MELGEARNGPSGSRLELEIVETSLIGEGCPFGETGPYELLSGRARHAVDPAAAVQRGIVDLEFAPRDADGLVRFEADVQILRPVEPSRGNRRLLYDYGNRGNKRALQFFCDAPATNRPRSAADMGNGFLLRRGYTVVWSGWQGDLLPGDGRLLLDLPVARNGADPITGPVRTEFIASAPGITTYPLSGQASTRSHPTVSLDPRRAALTRRRYADDPRIPIAPERWMFARLEGGRGLDNRGEETAIVPSPTHIHLPEGFEPGWIYELVYTGRDPLVLGLGHAAVRDLVSFLKHEAADAAGRPNPLRSAAARIEKAYCWGRSQTGRCIRDFIYLGFNADASGRGVFDGAMPHVSGAGRLWLNYRFANVVSPPGQQYEQRYSVVDRFPFGYAPLTDPATGQSDAILKRPATDPLVIHTQTAVEYWQRRGSLVHTDLAGEDVEPPPGVRIYHWASSQHFSDPNMGAPTRGICQNLNNPVQTSMLFRALLDALDAWASTGAPPPDSRFPRRGDGTLLTFQEWRAQFPAIPGTALPRGPSTLPALDWGPDLDRGRLAEPPAVLGTDSHPVLVPAVDEDGNEIAGVRAPMVQAPLATYTGWNLRARGFGTGALYYDLGSCLPFPDTPEERAMTSDPRPSVRERYGDAAGYVAAIRRAAERLVGEGFMLAEDVERVVERAADWSRPLHDVRL